MSASRACALAVLALVLAACGGQSRPGRERYNEGLALLAKGDHAGAQKAFLAARDQAGVDPELRYRAAFNLGMTLTAEADAAKADEQEDPSKALGLYQQAIAWFGDALRVRKGDAAATSNLAIVTARARALEDQLAKEAGRLEAKLDALIGAQRGVLDGARGAWLAIKRSASGDPLAEQSALVSAADAQRGLTAEAGVIADLAAAEIDSIGAKSEDKRSDEEKARLVQLQNLDLYLMDARSRMAEARGRLQELAAEAGANRSEAALVALKRAKEQLLDPIAVLRGISRDELELFGEAQASLQLAGQAPAQPVPGWLAASALAERQGPIIDRLTEVQARLRAGLDGAVPAEAAPPSAAAPGTSPPTGAAPSAPTSPLGAAPPTGNAAASPPADDPKARAKEQLLAKVRVAMPLLDDALAELRRARDELSSSKVAPAAEAMRKALLALSTAVELFADLKQTLELAWREQKRVLTMLGPEAAKQWPADERAAETRDGLARNRDRLVRLAELLSEERTKSMAQAEEALAKATAEAAAAPGAAPGAPAGPGNPPGAAPSAPVGPGNAGTAAGADPAAEAVEAARTRVEQLRAQLDRAEELRVGALAAIGEAQKALASSADPTAKAKEADTKIEELRRSFFDLLEHLQELLREQGETRDRTAAAAPLGAVDQSGVLPGIFDRQTQHRQMNGSLDAALSKQADQAASAQNGAEQQKKLAAAAEELRQAGNQMDRALGTIVNVRDQVGGKSHQLSPATEAQDKAIAHLEEALRILSPPQKQQQNQDQDKSQQQQQEAARPQGGATQSARDKDAERQRQRQREDSAPVEKDW